MSTSFLINIGAIFVIFTVSMIGAYTPQFLKGQISTLQFADTLSFRSLKTFSGGLIVAVAFCHLLSDSVEDLNDDQLVFGTPGYPCKLLCI
jgi:hypothetical protein